MIDVKQYPDGDRLALHQTAPQSCMGTSYSAHADGDEIIAWLKGFEHAPRKVFVTHGEPDAADALRKRIAEELGWNAHVPDHVETVTLDFVGDRDG